MGCCYLVRRSIKAYNGQSRNFSFNGTLGFDLYGKPWDLGSAKYGKVFLDICGLG
jgi:hypothetical protein